MVELTQSLPVWIFRAQDLSVGFSNPRGCAPESENCAYFLLLLLVKLLTTTTSICNSCYVPDAILSILDVLSFGILPRSWWCYYPHFSNENFVAQCTGLKGVPAPIHVHPEPQNVTFFGNSAFADIIS